ncbi:MAG TPA: TetR/AcrR family transcriptional regulator [Mycobacteriales bacterium]
MASHRRRVPVDVDGGARPTGRTAARDGDGRKQRWAAHREARRSELVDAAVRAITVRGPGVGMDDIAAEAGVTKPVVYRYFTDKADLYVAVGQRAAGDLLTEVVGAIEAGGRPKDLLTTAVDAYLAQIERAPNLYRFVVARPFLDRAPSTDIVHDYRSLIASAVARSMGEGLRAAGLDSGGAEAWGHGVVGFVQQAGDWWIERRTMSRADLTRYVVALLWGGLLELHRQAGDDPDAGSAGGLVLLAPPAAELG